MAEHVFQWRNMMEFFLIKHFRRCLPLLLKYDAVGASARNGQPSLCSKSDCDFMDDICMKTSGISRPQKAASCLHLLSRLRSSDMMG